MFVGNVRRAMCVAGFNDDILVSFFVAMNDRQINNYEGLIESVEKNFIPSKNCCLTGCLFPIQNQMTFHNKHNKFMV